MSQSIRKFHHRDREGKTTEYVATIIKREGPVVEGTTPSPEFRHAMKTHFIVHLAPGESFVEVLDTVK